MSGAEKPTAGAPEQFEAHPHLLRRQAVLWTIVMGGAALLGWFMLPAAIRAMFTLPQILTLAFFLVFMLGVVWTVASGWVRADASGLSGRNGLRNYRIGWNEIDSIRYRDGDHWAFVELNDTTDRPLLGIMRSDGEMADDKVEELRALAARHIRP